MTNKDFIKNAITYNHNDKMQGMYSLSTACTKCKSCIAMHNTNDEMHICKHCYSFKMLKRFTNLRAKLERNFDFFTTVDIQPSDVPTINNKWFRFEAFGDLNNALQFKNYVTIAKCNPTTNFAIWTKKPYIVEDAFDVYDIRKPSNLVIIYSDPYINKRLTGADFKALTAKYPFIDKVFTVHDKNGLADEHINCGGRKCAECLKCYTHNDITIINERLK